MKFLKIVLPPLAMLGVFAAALPVISIRREKPKPPPPKTEEMILPAKITFNQHIQPILSEHCFRCHGPDSGARKAELRLDRETFALLPRKNGKPVILRGNPAGSALIRRIKSKDPEEVMPPPESHKELKREEIAILERWVQQGAEYQEHWAFIRPVRPAPPEGSEKNPIDRFVFDRLKKAGLSPNPEADRRALVRRVTLDLTGLPPTPEEVEAFVNDSSADAYEKVVDRLLASPRYGEHRARTWLDNVRYADTHGFHFDNYRSIWPYRDWVIRAFNENMPFDQFTIEQIAGDLLPNPTISQRIATGYNRCAMSSNEGGTIPEEYEAIYAKDRVETTGQVWLGLTVGCATCHNHKFDPITQNEFYQLTAFFRNTTQPTMDGNIADTPPVVRIPRPEDAARAEKLPGEMEAAKKELEARVAAVEPEFIRWQREMEPVRLHQADPADLVFELMPDGADPKILYDIASEDRTFAIQGQPVREVSPNGAAVKFPPETFAELGAICDLEANQPFAYGGWVKLPENANGAILARMDMQDNYRGWDLWVQGNRIAAHIISKWNVDALKVAAKAPLPPNKWTHVFVTYDGSKKIGGLKIFYNGAQQDVDIEAAALNGSIKTATPTRVGRRSHGQACVNVSVNDLRFYARLVRPEEIQAIARRPELLAILAIPPDQRKPEQLKPLRDYYLGTIDAGTIEGRQTLTRLQVEQRMMDARSTPSLVAEERKDQTPFAYVLIRGQYDQKAERVTAGVPKVLPPLPAGVPANRLALARWLVSDDHPLTARVNVNRFWAQLFGTGLVRTAGEFGIMGERPSHPELLDWLAVEFRESKWDVKQLFRLMVTSATYRQSSVNSPEKREKDPENRLLSRGPRFRMEGEMLRDQALAVAGLLSDKIGGPGVKPYQPAGLWEAVAMEESNTRSYMQDKGENLFRRSLYTFWKRALPPPNMETFNAPTREECCVRRERTNTPLQALVMLNDPQFVEAARHLAVIALKQSPETGKRLDTMAARLLSRPLGADEKSALERSLADLRRRFEKDTKSAEMLLHIGETPVDATISVTDQAAWTLVASQFFNLDEALNK